MKISYLTRCLALISSIISASAAPATAKKIFKSPEKAILEAQQLLSINSRQQDPFGLYQSEDSIPKAPAPPKIKDPTDNKQPVQDLPSTDLPSADLAFQELRVYGIDFGRQLIIASGGERVRIGETIFLSDRKKNFSFRLKQITDRVLVFEEVSSKRTFQLVHDFKPSL